MSSETNPRSGFENAVFALGLVLVLALVGALAWEAVAGPSGPPRLTVRVGASDAGGLVPVALENTGGSVAEAVRVEVCAAGGDPCAEVEVPYVPVGAERRATVGFGEAPAGPLEGRIVSFLEP